MLLTMRDGQGVPSDAEGAVRVISLSGAGDGQDVPQGAVTVDLHACQSRDVESEVGRKKLLTWALAPTATRARARTENFMMLMGIWKRPKTGLVTTK